MARTNRSIYTPVRFADGTLRVQVCNNDFDHFVGWADGSGKFEHPGTWTVCDRWAPEQSAQLAKRTADAKNNFGESEVSVTTHGDGVSRVLTVRY